MLGLRDAGRPASENDRLISHLSCIIRLKNVGAVAVAHYRVQKEDYA